MVRLNAHALGSDSEGIEFHLSPGDWIKLLRVNGFEIEHLIEVYPPEAATTRFPYVLVAWACEEVWKGRKRR